MRHGRIEILVGISGLLAASGCTTLPVGSGRIVSEPREVDDFDGVAVDSGLAADVSVVPGAGASVTVIGDDNLVGYVETSVAAGVLSVRLPDRALDPNDHDHLRVEITAPRLSSLRAAGAADVTAHGLVADRISLSSDGAARLAPAGEADAVDARATGGGRIEARTLVAREVVAIADGAGRLEVCADGRLELHLSGGSHALYACDPGDVSIDAQSGSSAQPE